MADAKAQREAAEAATLRRKAEQLEGQAIVLAEKWTGVHNLKPGCAFLLGLHLQISDCQYGLPLQRTQILQHHVASGHTAASSCLMTSYMSSSLLLLSLPRAFPKALFLCVCMCGKAFNQRPEKLVGTLKESLPFQPPSLTGQLATL